MNNLDQHKPGGKSERRKQKRNKKKAEQPASPAPEQAQAESEALYAAMAEPVASAAEVASAEEKAPAEPVVEHKAPVAPADTARAERVASFRERMASVAPPADTTPGKPSAPADVAQAAPSPAAAPAAGIQAIAEAYRDYTRKSLKDAQTFAEKLSAARSLDKAVEAQTEFARQACETFADNSRKIRELHRELFWQAFRLPNWPAGKTQR